jgi:hypothetical protein
MHYHEVTAFVLFACIVCAGICVFVRLPPPELHGRDPLPSRHMWVGGTGRLPVANWECNDLAVDDGGRDVRRSKTIRQARRKALLGSREMANMGCKNAVTVATAPMIGAIF